eukprot:2278243-Rhodomonas_salina.2
MARAHARTERALLLCVLRAGAGGRGANRFDLGEYQHEQDDGRIRGVLLPTYYFLLLLPHNYE